jgi:peroxiredoxin
MTSHDFPLPDDLPRPMDNGAADHLTGQILPDLGLPSTGGQVILLTVLGQPRTVLYLYPMTGRPGIPLPGGWDLIPGARGCTPESCAFRDHHDELQAAGVDVYGLSSQSSDDQKEAVARLHLPFPLLSDETLTLADSLRLPTFTVDGTRLFTRLTMVITDGLIEHVFYPVFPTDQHADEVLRWLHEH